MKFFLFALIAVFVSVAVLGVFAMGHQRGGSGCLAAAAHGGACPPENGFALAGFYLEALRGFSSGNIGLWIGLEILAVLFLAVSVFISISPAPESGRSSARYQPFDSEILPRKSFLISWLSLRERRDPALSL